MTAYHEPVLFNEALFYLNIKPGEKYIDCTLGGGGHSGGIVERGGILLSLDQDEEALSYVKNEISHSRWKLDQSVLETKWFLRKGNFSGLAQISKETGFDNVSGILFDLGVSSHQLDAAYRGFSFNKEANLDMRMDRDLQVTAADLVNAGSEDELSNLFSRYGEERFARRIAKAIVEERKRLQAEGKNGISSTNELASIIVGVRPKTKGDRMHPATRVFQALRVAVNSELENLQTGLEHGMSLLKKNGRLVVISFHSLEDRIVKDFFLANKTNGKILTLKPIEASDEEVNLNPRSRSGKLRAFLKE